ncbi:hypothetical protein KC909_02135 [Candidatus Dojkabacteria bacterium]|uniref:Response regulatory domain-containing protein n=1 Tax=Candidatus Dojkabacteria bacterium TaxID=2099670 RepID=A0A955L4Y0_9BACT|nr:hypothetical protein [Candidatus Dojkabacteria bacterium]
MSEQNSVLLTEDDMILRLTHQKLLNHLGLSLHVTTSNEEGLSIMQEESGIVAVMADNHTYGELQGIDFLAELVEQDYPGQLLLCSATTFEHMWEMAVDRGIQEQIVMIEKDVSVAAAIYMKIAADMPDMLQVISREGIIQALGFDLDIDTWNVMNLSDAFSVNRAIMNDILTGRFDWDYFWQMAQIKTASWIELQDMIGDTATRLRVEQMISAQESQAKPTGFNLIQFLLSKLRG